MKQTILLLFALAFSISSSFAQSLRQANSLLKENGKYYLLENGRKNPVNEKVITVKIKDGKADVKKGLNIIRDNKLGYLDILVPDSIPLEEYATRLDRSGHFGFI